MPNLSVRNLDAAILARIKATARLRRVSVNRLVLEVLRAHFSDQIAGPDALDPLAGSWTTEEAEEFNSAIAPFGQIDPALWPASVTHNE